MRMRKISHNKTILMMKKAVEEKKERSAVRASQHHSCRLSLLVEFLRVKH
jgi:hypothetical protein